MNANFYIRMYTVMYFGFGLGVMVLGMVYPAVMLLVFCPRPGEGGLLGVVEAEGTEPAVLNLPGCVSRAAGRARSGGPSTGGG